MSKRLAIATLSTALLCLLASAYAPPRATAQERGSQGDLKKIAAKEQAAQPPTNIDGKIKEIIVSTESKGREARIVLVVEDGGMAKVTVDLGRHNGDLLFQLLMDAAKQNWQVGVSIDEETVVTAVSVSPTHR